MAVSFLANSHQRWIGESGDAASATAVLFLKHTMPVNRSSERLFLNEIVSLAENSFGTSRSLEVVNFDKICLGEKR